jgi:hypothetical protein
MLGTLSSKKKEKKERTSTALLDAVRTVAIHGPSRVRTCWRVFEGHLDGIAHAMAVKRHGGKGPKVLHTDCMASSGNECISFDL